MREAAGSRGRRVWRGLLVYFGLAAPPGGKPLPGGPGVSRYGPRVSPRVDQDIDDLVARVEALERERRGR